MNFTIEDISPAKANIYLAAKVVNRPISQGVVSAYVRDMISGKFALTHQGIAFFDDGTLADGEHRLLAIIKSGITVKMVVCTGMKHTPYLDIQRPRSISDCCKIDGDDWITRAVVACVGVIRPSKGKSSLTVVRETALIYRQEILAVGACIKRKHKGVSHSAVYGAAVLYLIHGGLDEHVESMYRVLYSGIAECRREQIILKLRDFLMLSKTSGSGEEMRRQINFRVQRVLKSLHDDDGIKNIVMPDAPIYPFVK